MADDEAEAAEGGEEAKEETKEDAPKDAPKDAAKDAAKDAPKDAPKEAPKEGSAAPSGGGGKPNKQVKTKKNQFAMNRLLLMLMDVRPEALSAETIEDLKKVYALLVNIHAQYKG